MPLAIQHICHFFWQICPISYKLETPEEKLGALGSHTHVIGKMLVLHLQKILETALQIINSIDYITIQCCLIPFTASLVVQRCKKYYFLLVSDVPPEGTEGLQPFIWGAPALFWGGKRLLRGATGIKYMHISSVSN